MKRFYLTYLEGLKSVSVRLRTNHATIYNSLKIDDKDDVKVLKELYKMELNEFVTLVRSTLGERPYREYHQLNSAKDKAHDEEWYNGAWKYTTKKVEDMLKLPDSPEMDETEFFSLWEQVVAEEKRIKAEERRRVEEERKALESKKEKKLLKKKVEAEEDSLTEDELARMVEELFAPIKEKAGKSRLVKKTKNTIKRKQK